MTGNDVRRKIYEMYQHRLETGQMFNNTKEKDPNESYSLYDIIAELYNYKFLLQNNKDTESIDKIEYLTNMIVQLEEELAQFTE